MSSQVACISGESEKIGVAIACVPLTLLQYTILDPVPILCATLLTVHSRLRFSIIKILENRNGLHQIVMIRKTSIVDVSLKIIFYVKLIIFLPFFFILNDIVDLTGSINNLRPSCIKHNQIAKGQLVIRM